VNVLWVVLDALRADRLGCYGYGRPTSPNLDRFAGEAVRFTQCISPHIPTHPAHTTMFSGRDVFAHGVVAQGGRAEPPPDLALLPGLLRERGYFTAAADNIGRWVAPAFEAYEETPRWDHDGSRPWRVGEEVTAAGLRLLERARDDARPFFLFLHYWDPHTPYLPPPPFHRMFYDGDERDPASRSMDDVWRSPWFANYFAEWLPGVTDRAYVLAEYDASVAYADACLGRVLDRLRELGLWDDTLIVVCADHGEELDDHGCWFDHHGLYDTNVRVPLLLRHPDGRGAGRTRDDMVTLLDLAPTVLDALGLGSEPPGHPPSGGVYLTECTWMRKRGWRTPRWKLIRALEPDIYGFPPIELYDLMNDPAEQRSLAEARPDVVGELTAAMDAWVARRLAETGRPDPLVAQADALRTWQPRFIAGRRG
jgi:arylsulfatase A-like enzyme